VLLDRDLAAQQRQAGDAARTMAPIWPSDDGTASTIQRRPRQASRAHGQRGVRAMPSTACATTATAAILKAMQPAGIGEIAEPETP